MVIYMTKNVGIMGGTFNPIHNGHLALAQAAYEQICLDKILFMPSGISYLKNGVLDVRHRINMTSLAIKPYPYFELSLVEAEREGNTYTSDTLQLLNNHNPTINYYFIMGADSLFQIESWHEPQIIYSLCTLICAIRDDYDKRAIYEKGKQLKSLGAKILYLDMPKIDISSTNIRQSVANMIPISNEVPYEVEQYILKEKLYYEKNI